MSTTTTTSIEIPQLDGESSPAYAARVHYLTLGPERSLAAVGRALGKSRVLMERWSAAHAWQEHARRYDQTLAGLAAQQAAADQTRRIKAHQERARQTGEDLYTAAHALLRQCARAVRGEVIHGADGQTYTIPTMELTPSTFGIAMKGLLLALDMETHALGLDQILATMSEEARRDEL